MGPDRAEGRRDKWRTHIGNLDTVKQTSKGQCLISFLPLWSCIIAALQRPKGQEQREKNVI